MHVRENYPRDQLSHPLGGFDDAGCAAREVCVDQRETVVFTHEVAVEPP
jgi:hypothetical protein